MSFAELKFLIINNSNLSFFFLSWILLLMLYLKTHPQTSSPKFSPVLSFRTFVVYVLRLRLRYILSWFFFLKCITSMRLRSIILCMDVQVFQHYLLKLSFSTELLLLLYQSLVLCNCVDLFLDSYSIDQLSIVSPIPCCFDYCTFIVSLKMSESLSLFKSFLFAFCFEQFLQWYA